MSEFDLNEVVTEGINEGLVQSFQLFRPYFKYIFLILLIQLLFLILEIRKKRKIRSQIRDLANNTTEITPEEFFKIRNKSFGGRGNPLYSNNYNFTGVYILHNKTKDLYYVGQGKKVFNRINSHLRGSGNGDVYADYKYNDSFTIRTIALESSGFKSIDELERHAIETYDAYKKGYNRNRGNR